MSLEHFFLIVVLLFPLPHHNFAMVYLLAKLLQYPEHSLLIVIPVWCELYHYMDLTSDSSHLVL